MDAQVENAIEIAWNPASDQNLKAQAFDFLNQLRADPSGWQVCLNLFIRAPPASEVVRYVVLEVIINALQIQQLDSQSLNYLKSSLWEYTKKTYGASANPEQVDSASIQNKLTQTLTLLFASLYKQGWESFFDDILGLTVSSDNQSRSNLPGVILYLRLLSSVHDEIADVLLTRSVEESTRNTELKDLLRARDVPKVTNSWRELLTQWRDQNDAVLETCLKVIGRWVSWIDISLVVNQDFLNLLFQLVGRANASQGADKVRDASIDCFTEIVGKKMKPGDKMELLVFLNLGEIVSQLVEGPALKDLRSTSDYDTDLAEAVAKLVNNSVFDMVKALEDTGTDVSVKARADQLLQTFIPLLLRFFSDEYDEVCSNVIPSLTDILTFFRKTQSLPAHYQNALTPILNAIMAKMRYDESCEWDNEDEQTDDAEFQELRKRLQVLQKTVAAIDQNLYIEILSNVVGNTFQTYDQQAGQMDWRDLDLALHEMYLFGELALPNAGLYAKSQPSGVAAERLVAMMTKMVQSGIASFGHPAIQLQYMEICVRYCSFFEAHTETIPQVLEEFVRLVHHSHVRVRSRSWYLFLRFVKHLRAQVGNIAETIIQSIADLLPIKAELPREDDGDMSSDETDHSSDALFSNQLYLFEAIGCISSTTSTPVEKQTLYARSVMDPLFADIEQHLPPAKSGDKQAILQIHHIIMALGTLANGYSDWTPGTSSSNSRKEPHKEVAQEFGRASEAILISLESLKSSLDIRTAARSSFSRLVGVLGADILPQLPRWIDGLLSESSSKDEMALFLRSLDLVIFGFKTEIYPVLDSLLTPLLQRVFAGLAEPVTGTDDEIQLAELRREYLSFIQVLLNNDLGPVLVSASNQGFFELLVSSLTSLAAGAGNTSGTLSISRLAFIVLTRMVQLWGGPDIVKPSPNPAPPTAQPSPSFPGFDRFAIERFNPVCWEVLRDPQFRPLDAQARQVLTEIAGLEQTIYAKTGNMFIEHLQGSFFPSLGVDGTEFIRQLMTSGDRKVFTGFLQAFLKQRR